MKKGFIKLTSSGNKFSVSIDFHNGKNPTTVSGWKESDEKFKDLEVDVLTESGIVKEVYLNKEKIYPKKQEKRKTNNSQPNSINQNFHRNTSSNYQRGENMQIPKVREARRDTIENDGSYDLPSGSAKAPYNFIPLQKENEVVYVNDLPTQDRFHKDRLTGYIELDIKTLTPVYIRDSLTKKEIEDSTKIKHDKSKYINPNFFSPFGEGKYAISGSSMRGMIRSLVEIISFGNFGYFDDKRLYYRGVADKYLADIYRKYLVSGKNENYLPKMKAGYLYKRSQDNYIIKPAKAIEGTQWYKVNYTTVKGNKNHDKLFFIPQKVEDHYHQRISGNLRYPLIQNISKEKKTNTIEGILIISGHIQRKHMHWIINLPEEGKEIKVSESVIEEYKGDSSREEKADLFNEKYHKEISGLGIPCFYLSEVNEQNEEEIIAFGYTGMFRLPYEKTIGDLIPTKQKPITSLNGKYENLDYANAIFGFVYDPKKNEEEYNRIIKAIAGRVSFSDFISDEVELMEELVPKILSNPKPTTFQHYLEQSRVSENGRERKHYNSNTNIRGNKLYWHQSNVSHNAFVENDVIIYTDVHQDKIRKVTISQNELIEYVRKYNSENFSDAAKDNIHKELINKVIKQLGRNTLPQDDKELKKEVKEHFSQYTIIKPIKKASFKGKIYFENLSEKELGCLLFALDLPQDCAHKIGMGKSYGLGSIKVTPTLYISNRSSLENGRYSSLQFEWKDIPKSIQSSEYYKNSFSVGLSSALSSNIQNWKQLWETPRLRELRKMLNLKNDLMNDKLSYMQISRFTGKIKENSQGQKKPDTENDFKNRPILSQPTKYK